MTMGDLWRDVLDADWFTVVCGAFSGLRKIGGCAEVAEVDFVLPDEDVPSRDVCVPDFFFHMKIVNSTRKAAIETLDASLITVPRRATQPDQKVKEVTLSDGLHQVGDVVIVGVRPNVRDKVSVGEFLQNPNLLDQIVLPSYVVLRVSSPGHSLPSIHLGAELTQDLVDHPSRDCFSVSSACKIRTAYELTQNLLDPRLGSA